MIYRHKLEFLVIGFIIGMTLFRYLNFLKLCPTVIFFVVGLFFLFLFRVKRKIYFLFGFFILLGCWRYALLWPKDLTGRIENYYNQDFVILGQVMAEPEISGDKQKIKFNILNGFQEHENNFELRGNVLIFTDKYPSYHYGDLLSITGRCSDPGFIDDFDYSLYLKRYGLTAVFYYPTIEKNNSYLLKKKNVFNTFIYNFRNKLSDRFDYYLTIDSSAFIKAMLLNNKNSLSVEIKNDFSVSGLSHIIAISGLHISLMSALLLNFLIFIGLKRKTAFYFISLFLIFYLFLVGSPASAVRATVMALLSLTALSFGQSYDMSRIIFLTGFLMLLINPLFLWADLGFVLSFLAVLAIVYINPEVSLFLTKFFSKIKTKQSIIDIISITLSVQLLSTPILISNFNQFSILALFSNLFVLWIISVVMILSLIALFLSFVIPVLALLLFLILDYFLKYILFISHFISIMPGAVIKINNWPWYLSVIYYIILFYFFCRLKIKKQRTY